MRERKVKPYERDELRNLIDAVLEQFGGVRWVIALALGLRQGELLAPQWSDVDLDRDVPTVDDSRRGPATNTAATRTAGSGHLSCAPTICAVTRPRRYQVRGFAPQHRTPRRTRPNLKAHKGAPTGREYLGARQVGELQLGLHRCARRPLNNKRDYHRWKAFIEVADVRNARLHDARHTAETTLLLLGVSARAVIDIMAGRPASDHALSACHRRRSPGRAARVGSFISGTPPTPWSARTRTARTTRNH